jgi:hypothetical protein
VYHVNLKNYCNYHIIRNDISTEDQNGNVIYNDKYTLINTEELKHFKLPDQIIDIIKKINGCQILGFNYDFNNQRLGAILDLKVQF